MKLHGLPRGFLNPRAGLKDVMKELETIINLEEEDELQEFISIVKSPSSPLSWADLVWLALNSEKISTLFETDEVLNEEWSKRLVRLNNPGFPLVSLRGGEGISVFSQFKGAYFWNCYKHQKERGLGKSLDALGYLDNACQCGTYYAMIEKMNILQTMLETSGTAQIASELVEWIDLLADLYWTPGLMNAGVYAIAVAGYCRDHQEDTRCSAMLESAMRAFLVGFYIAEHEHSIQLSEVFYPENGWLDIFTDHPQCAEWRNSDDALAYFERVLAKNFMIEDAAVYIPDRADRARSEAVEIFERHPSESFSLEMKY